MNPLLLATLALAAYLALAPAPAAATGAVVCVSNGGPYTCVEAGDPATSVLACGEFSFLGPLSFAVAACV